MFSVSRPGKNIAKVEMAEMIQNIKVIFATFLSDISPCTETLFFIYFFIYEQRSIFGVLKSGEHVERFVLEKGGLEVTLMNFGATLISMKAPDKNGVPEVPVSLLFHF